MEDYMDGTLTGTSERPIIAVTGSTGKTTVKSMVASILRQRWNIFESQNAENTVRNTSMHQTRITNEHNAAVLEYGMSYYGHIKRHCLCIQPNISIITNVGTAHIGHFKGSIEELIKAKSELIEGMDQN
jgi:UDP-N-acetylmuramoyl-tripeptide--D-alanyl-D-alanine ligase